MAITDTARRWLRDRMTRDEHVDGPPAEKIQHLFEALPTLTPQERSRSLEHLTAYTTYYYQGHQREPVPLEVKQDLHLLQKEASRLTAVDQARETLEKFGGPPTRLTIAESLERSEKQRTQALERGPVPERTREHAVEMSL